ncbi:Bifunctional inhibitor/plant lipid transfer protein/seed storage helical domain [Macleaya cordata]|uniref:Bifunctional inhibitor/plant lipid transfer protein/seed storage helical domain n=1 Tax=Macleaya cordata TaxID=56857 RepID=A0A200R481_MACCD|nr:Bifunctional inhibitor/plant lipid transfer protein/seed storage helical domain [Macleaya cordata]
MRTTRQQTDLVVLIVFITICSVFFCSSAAPSSAPSSSPSVEDKCKKEFSKVGVCLDYATGKAKVPSQECCTTVDDIKKRDAVCLCYVIQQVHEGEATLKQLGVQEAKLLQLPGACKLTNINISTDCPKLLNISSTSPDYAIFSNSSSSAPSSSHPTADDASLPNKSDSSSASNIEFFVHGRPHIAGPTITITVAILIFISVLFPSSGA